MIRSFMGTFSRRPASKPVATGMMGDSTLVARCLKGDQGAYAEFIERYQDRLYNTVFRLLGHAEDAQDVVQEVFLSAFQGLRQYKGEAQVFTWLYRIAVNAAISQRRRRRAAVSISSQPFGVNAVEPSDPSRDSLPGTALERSEDEQVLQEALNRLSDDHRSVLVLKEIEELKYEEIAEILEIPIGTVRSRLHRARLELRHALRDYVP